MSGALDAFIECCLPLSASGVGMGLRGRELHWVARVGLGVILCKQQFQCRNESLVDGTEKQAGRPANQQSQHS